MTYSFIDHLHNYATWTASRASQRSFTTTVNIKAAIDKTELKDLISNEEKYAKKNFDEFHRETASIIIKHLSDMGIHTTYGRAAKIIAIYLKTAIVIRNSGKGELSKNIHPPIDNILLTNLNRRHPNLKLKGIRWTHLNEDQYFNLIKILRTIPLNNFWELEKDWKI